MRCGNCGEEISDGSKFCPNCGTDTIPEAQHAAGEPTPGSKQKLKKPLYKRVWFWVAAVIVVFAIAQGVAGGQNNSATNTSTAKDTAVTESATSSSSSSDTTTKDEGTDANKEKDIPTEYVNALYKAQQYSDSMYMSKEGIYDQLTSDYGEGFGKKAATYAINNVVADWNKNALEKAKTYQSEMHMSKSAIYDQLVSSYGEKFTSSQASYAIKHL